MMNIFYDTRILTARVLKQTVKSVDTLFTVILMPVMILLASVYIYGSAMGVSTKEYVTYLVPGILALTIATASAYTAYRIAQDIQKGIFERFYSMPIAKSSILAGHVYTSVLYNFVSVAFVLLISLVFGYRLEIGWKSTLLAFLLVTIFNFGITWIGVFFGLVSKNVEMASIFSYILMALVFVSSAFAPTTTMANGLKVFAEHQPFTFVINGLRTLLSEGKTSADLWLGFLVSALIWIVFRIASVLVYKRKLSK